MTPELWQRLKPLYHAALEIPSEARAQFVRKACSHDEELQQNLIALLKASKEETLERDRPVADLQQMFAQQRRSFQPGDLILNQFRIVRYLGRGGMGEVYEAQDLKMGRVALKTIRSEIASDPEMLARFRKEVQLALKITDPHVCRIYAPHVLPGQDGEADREFVTMEFLDGITLAAKIRQSGPLPWEEAKRIALDICRGLQAVHDAGIIHRDLKSGNIILTSRRGRPCAVLMDFGLAREFRAAPSEDEASPTLTVPGQVVGTTLYMAPEQFAGDPLTPATDMFALGVVLYELLTGKHPFPSDSALEAAVQRGRRPAPPSSIKRGLPRRCDAIVARCLEFDPNRRYPSAKTAAEDIEGRLFSETTLRRTWFRAAVSVIIGVPLLPGLLVMPAARERVQGILFADRVKHIAVLPFETADQDPQNQAVGDGLTDSLAGRLSNLRTGNASLWVVPPSEVRSKKVKDPSSARKTFGATIVVEGQFERMGQTARLALTVIDPRKMKEIGFTEVTNQAGDLAALEDDAVTRLGRLINLSTSQARISDRAASEGPAAYQDYLAAEGYIQRYDLPGNLDAAVTSLRRAVATDSHFALGFAELGEAYRLKYQLDKNPSWLASAQNYCATAISLNSGIASPYVTLARIHDLKGRRDLALQEFQRALEIDPGNSSAINGLGYVYESMGNAALAEASFRKAAALRPDDEDSYDELANFYERQHKFPQAFAQYKRTIEMAPDSEQAYANLGMAYIDSNDARNWPEAEEALKKSIALFPTYNALANLGVLYAAEKRYGDYASATERALQLDDHDWRVWGNLVSAYEWLKDKKRANAARGTMLEHLQQAVKVRPQDADAQSTLAIVYAHNGQEEDAVTHIRTALALAPGDPVVLSNVADAYELLGRPRRAVEYLNTAFRKGLMKADVEQDPYLQDLIKNPGLRLPPK